ncbi:MAG: sugar phosphate isomerase/epimerase [Bacteroidetes bacterium]|nr:sugar phosphate isomerase/epimerase [Bacteroidota bacterium]
MIRRKFLQSAGMAAVGLGWKGGFVEESVSSAVAGSAAAGALQLGLAGYTFLHVPLDQGIAMMKRVGVNALSIKDFYLPLDSDGAKVQEVKEKFTSAGLKIYAAGVIYMKTQQEVDRAFEYAKLLGIDMIVGVPNPELLSYTEQKVKAYNIRVAIHNHGPEDKLYPSPVDVYEHIKGLDSRIGLCLDIGHAARAGADPVEVIGKYSSRLFDMHIKDLSVIVRESKTINLGRGVLDIPGVIKALKKIKYAGYCSIEHELDMNDPLPGVAESVGYFRGVDRVVG